MRVHALGPFWPQRAVLHSLPFAFYVDPGSGSMVLQLLLGGVSGIYVFFRLFKQKILGFFGIRSEAAQPAEAVPCIPPKDDHARRQV